MDKMTDASDEVDLRLTNLRGYMEANGVAEDVVKFSIMVEQQKRFVYDVYKTAAAAAPNPMSYQAWCTVRCLRLRIRTPTLPSISACSIITLIRFPLAGWAFDRSMCLCYRRLP